MISVLKVGMSIYDAREYDVYTGITSYVVKQIDHYRGEAMIQGLSKSFNKSWRSLEELEDYWTELEVMARSLHGE